ncbi:MAG TPA: hypothetical protein VLB49_02775 [Gemmatimonadales bacterium]|nr:hypothetical protein [Gemmatimonadales bacterium]
MVRWFVSMVAACVALACTVHYVAIEQVPRTGDSVAVATAVKAHLLNGQTVVFPDGITLAHDTVRGSGTRYDLRLQLAGPVSVLPLDSVLGLEAYRTRVDAVPTALLTTLAIVGTAAATVSAIIIIECASDPKCFGSCPTFYSDSAGTQVLEAEGFSYSIAPLFEARDVDRLRAQPDAQGVLRLEVRDEAYETHYVNQLELLEARHGSDEFVVPDGQGRLVAIGRVEAPVVARDRAGRDVRRLLAAADGDVFRSDSVILAAARLGDLEDTIELEFPVPANLAGDSVALLFRMRNSLLNTVLLYDVMLGDAGARSLDWQAAELERVGPALQLGQWYAAKMGMRIAVWSDGDWHESAHLRDTGPVAWKDIAAVVPAPVGPVLRVRLSYVADDWRIDRVAAGFAVRRPGVRHHALALVVDAAGATDTAARASLVAADSRYLQTTAGQRFTAEWRPGDASPDSLRTFFLASQGYYIEWIRRGWLAAPRSRQTFVPSDSALAGAVARYRVVKDTLERRFLATRVPVR